MSNSMAPGSSADVNVRVTALTTNPNVPVTYKTIILKKNLVNGVNTLTQEMMSAQNTKYVIKYDYVLGEDITVPENCVLEFDGGSVSGAYTITGQNTDIEAGLVKIFNTNVTLAGTWNIIEIYPEWFGAKGNNSNDDTTSINRAVSISINIHKAVLFTGVYKITDSIEITNVNSVTLLGINRNDEESSSIVAYGHNYPIINQTAVTGAYGFYHRIENLILKYKDPQTANDIDSAAIILCGNIHSCYKNLFIQNAYNGIKETSNIVASWGNSFEDIDIDNCIHNGLSLANNNLYSNSINNRFDRISIYNGRGNDYGIVFPLNMINSYVGSIEFYGMYQMQGIKFPGIACVSINSIKFEHFAYEDDNNVLITLDNTCYIDVKEIVVNNNELDAQHFVNIFKAINYNSVVNVGNISLSPTVGRGKIYLTNSNSSIFKLHIQNINLLTTDLISTVINGILLSYGIHKEYITINSSTSIDTGIYDTIFIDGSDITCTLDYHFSAAMEVTPITIITNNATTLSYKEFYSGVEHTTTKSISAGTYKLLPKIADYQRVYTLVDATGAPV